MCILVQSYIGLESGHGTCLIVWVIMGYWKGLYFKTYHNPYRNCLGVAVIWDQIFNFSHVFISNIGISTELNFAPAIIEYHPKNSIYLQLSVAKLALLLVGVSIVSL